jgi:ketosteroid isomerase-like protein
MLAMAAVGMLSFAVPAQAQTPAENRHAVEARFEAWANGSGSPFDLLAEEASWTIEGNSLASKTYPTKEAFLAEVVKPFNARMTAGIKPGVRSITAEDDRVVILFDAEGTARDGKPYVNSYAWFFTMKAGRVMSASAIFDAVAFDDLWTRVTPAE